MLRLTLFCLLALPACDWLTPPCVKVARAICDVTSEGDSCAFVLNIESGDERGQRVCKQILPTAKALVADPHSASVHEEWQAARAALGQLGFTADESKGRIENKLKAFGGPGGKLVEDLEKANAEDERRTQERAQKVMEDEQR